MFILSPVPKIVPWQYRPFFWLFSDKKEKPTNTNIRDCFHSQNPKPGFWKNTRPIDAITAGVTLISGIGLITSFLKENKLWGYATGALAALGAIAFGWFKYYAADYTDTSEEIRERNAEIIAQRGAEKSQGVQKVKIDRQATTTTSTDTEIPLNLVRFPDEQVNENEYHIKIQGGNVHVFGVVGNDSNTMRFTDLPISSRSGLDIYKDILEKEALPRASKGLLKTLVPPEHRNKKRDELIRIAIEQWQPKTIKIDAVPHKTYKACIEENKIDILIPQFYVDARAKATEEIINALEFSLNRLPINLAKLIKQIKFHTGDLHQGIYHGIINLGNLGLQFSSTAMSAHYDSGLIDIYHGSFTGPLQDLDDIEKHIISSLRGSNVGALELGKIVVSNDVIAHEIGHFLEGYITKNHTSLAIPILNGNNLSINNEFAGYDYGNENDAWVKIINMDNNKISKYGEKSPAEDFAESVAAFLMDSNCFRELCPHRWAFLNAIIPQVKIQSNN